MLTRLSSSTVLAALILAAVVPVALASRPASGSQSRAITRAVRTTTVANLNQVPAREYRVTGIKITTLPAPRNGAWAIAQVTPTGRFRDTLQGATVILVKSGGTSIWTAVDVGTSEVGCGITPNAVLQDLYGMSGDVCPPGSGV
jgi:hypothetical protein